MHHTCITDISYSKRNLKGTFIIARLLKKIYYRYRTGISIINFGTHW